MFYQLILLSTLAVGSLSYRLNLDFMTTDDLQTYFSVSKLEQVPEYDIVSPAAYSGHNRRRRDIEWEEDRKEIKLTAFGDEFHLKLEENKQLLAEGLNVETHNSDGTIEKHPLKSRRCFYHGQLISHNVSGVAVSTCKGLTGMIALGRHNLYIRPLNDKHAKEYRRRRRDVENPHIIYRRTVEDDLSNAEDASSHFCGLDPEYPDAHIFQYAVAQQMEILMNGTVKDEDSNIRRKRDTGPKYLEVRVMADFDMVQFYGANDVIPYTLTLMNIVAARFAEPSLGTQIIIHIVKLGILNGDTLNENGASLTVSNDGRDTLQSWSTYQFNTNQHSDNNVNHWDHAVLISRKDLSLDGSNSLLGIAWSSGTCVPQLQASLSQDAGLSTGQIIAHEVGHTLGMSHDGAAGCPDRVNMMSSSRPNGPGGFIWSSCSRDNLNTFLRSSFKQCLNDFPIANTQHTINVQSRPGNTEEFTADKQCIQLDSIFSGSCTTNLEEICGKLSCRREIDNVCYSLVPAAEGTYCGQGKWCVSGQCVSNNGQGLSPVDGGWSSWGTFSQCSRTCGAGVRTRQRRCDNPTPLNGGVLCQGANNDHELCNRQNCATPQSTFPDEQCAATNDIPWNGNFFTWTSYFVGKTGDELCAFRCLGSNNILTNRGEYFADGTRCSDDGKNELLKCVDGMCEEFGCDGALSSTQRYDKCRVCGGDGSTCTLFQGTFNSGSQNSFTTFVDIPAGATSVEISNTNSRWSFLAVKLTQTDFYIFGRTRSGSEDHLYQDTFIKYTEDVNNGETIYIDGPTPVALSIQVYLLLDIDSSSSVRPQIIYEYYSDSPMQPVDPVNPNHWVTSEGPCSVTCGNGIISEVVGCFSPTSNGPLDDGQCDPSTKPSPIVRSCHLTACPNLNQWSRTLGPCSATCGNGFVQEIIVCLSTSGQTVDDSQCDPSTKPTPIVRSCHLTACPNLNQWSKTLGPCSATCGNGFAQETIVCLSTSGQTVDDSQCDPSTKPTPIVRSCHLTACPNLNQWSKTLGPCSATCGNGFAQEIIVCLSTSGQTVDDSQCDPSTRPTLTQQSCSNAECPTLWLPFNFGTCSASCGTGVRTRIVWCVRSLGGNLLRLDDSQCTFSAKPATTEQCSSSIACPTAPARGVWVIITSECSVTCGQGTTTAYVSCRPSTSSDEILSDTQCQQPKPFSQMECNREDCPVNGVWVTTAFSQCSVTCDGGTRTRTVTCKLSSNSEVVLPESQCDEESKPHIFETCKQETCPDPQPGYSWYVLNNYGPCSVTCGTGTQSQRVWCVNKSDSSNIFQVSDTLCANLIPPNVGTQQCIFPPCPVPAHWVSAQFGECSESCGPGITQRDVFCRSVTTAALLSDSHCDLSLKPETTQTCNNRDCTSAPLPPTENVPDKGVECAGLYTRPVIRLDRISSSTGGQFCKEGIVAGVGQTIKLTFTQCNVRCGEGTDRGLVRDGHRLYHLCCYGRTFTWTSATNYIQLEHLTQAAGHGYQMNVEFVGQAVESECDQILTSPTGVVTSPNYPGPYTNGQLCKYVIIAPPGKRVNLEFKVFSLHSTSPWAAFYCFNPDEDNVEIYDLDSTEGLRYCGRYNDPSQVRQPSLSNRVLIQFRSDNDGVGNGFLIDYNFVDV